jgi:hypothetical protein
VDRCHRSTPAHDVSVQVQAVVWRRERAGSFKTVNDLRVGVVRSLTNIAMFDRKSEVDVSAALRGHTAPHPLTYPGATIARRDSPESTGAFLSCSSYTPRSKGRKSVHGVP